MVRRVEDFIKFLGTAGARFVMIKQLRASGGIWISYKGTNVLIDPGPGSIVRASASKPKLDTSRLDGIILTHRHLDHSGDINVMIEAMTEGGFKKRGVVFCPEDALGKDSVILEYQKNFPQSIETFKENSVYKIENFKFSTSMRHIHPVETYGLKFEMNGAAVSLLTDTKYFPELIDFYGTAVSPSSDIPASGSSFLRRRDRTDILIIAVVFFEPRQGIDHLSLVDAEKIIDQVRPKKAILTHFGMTMLKAGPHIQARKLSEKLGIEVVAAYDGMTLEL